MLNVAPWNRQPLKVLWIEHEQLKLLDGCRDIPSHVGFEQSFENEKK